MEDASKKLIDETNNQLNNIHISSGSYRDRHLLQATILNENDPSEELTKIYHLVEAHCPIFRKLAINLFEKASHNSSHNVFPMDSEHLQFNCCTDSQVKISIEDILNKMEMMPPEWTLVQLTNMNYCQSGMEIKPTALQITVFECGQNTIKPLTVQVDPAVDPWGNPINIIKELNMSLEEINTGYIKLKNRLHGNIKETYSQYKLRINHGLKQHVKFVQDKWLAEWRILLSGRFSQVEVEEEISREVQKLLDEYTKTDISPKNHQILKHLLRAQGFIDQKQTKKILEYCFPDITNQEVINLYKSIKKFEAFGKLKRNPIILIVDGTIDQIPWEMLDILAEQSVSRMQSFHFTYALFNAHELEIENGRKLIKLNELKGGMLLNPSANLPQMEKRLSAFQKYWIKTWKTMIGKKPTEEEFLDYVTNCDIFMYSGHGDGMQYIRYPRLEKLRINAVVLLFGCKSVALQQKSSFIEPWGTNQYYIMCCCPCIIGNLYNVTDLDCDVLSTNFVSYWVPATEKKTHWLDFDLKTWYPGSTDIDISSLPKSATSKPQHIPDLLTALNKAKRSTKCTYITQASCVARGIPVKLV